MAADLDPAPRRRGLSRTFFAVCIVFIVVALAYRISGGRDRDTQSQVRALLLGQQEAWNAGDLERFMADYCDSEELTFFSGGTVEKGHAALLARYRRRYQSEGKEMGTLTFSDLDITPMGSSAMARGRWKVVTSKESFDGLFTLTLVRFHEGWKIMHDHTSQSEKKPAP